MTERDDRELQPGWHEDVFGTVLARPVPRAVILKLLALHATYALFLVILGTVFGWAVPLGMMLWPVAVLYTHWRITKSTPTITAAFDKIARTLEIGTETWTVPDGGALFLESFMREDRVFRRAWLRQGWRLSWVPEPELLSERSLPRRNRFTRELVHPRVRHGDPLPALPEGARVLATMRPSESLLMLASEVAFALQIPLVDVTGHGKERVDPVSARDRLAKLSDGQLAPAPTAVPANVERIERPGLVRLRLGMSRRWRRWVVVGAVAMVTGVAVGARVWPEALGWLLPMTVLYGAVMVLTPTEYKTIEITPTEVRIAQHICGFTLKRDPLRYADLTGVRAPAVEERTLGRKSQLVLSTATTQYAQLLLKRESAEYVRRCILHPPLRDDDSKVPYR